MDAAWSSRMAFADDEPTTQMVCGEYVHLFYPHMHLAIASNAQQLVDAAHESRLDLIVTDNNMHDGHKDSGIYAARQIRSFDRDVPIILMTGLIDERVRALAREAGVTEVIEKDGLAQFRRVLAQYLGQPIER